LKFIISQNSNIPRLGFSIRNKEFICLFFARKWAEKNVPAYKSRSKKCCVLQKDIRICVYLRTKSFEFV